MDRMTYKQFLKELAKQKGKDWFLEMGRWIRTTIGECPISSLQNDSCLVADEVGEAIGLRTGVINRIIAASDNRSTCKTRKDLLRVLGLKERK